MCTLLWLIPRMARRSPSRIPPIHPSTFIHYLPKFLYTYFSHLWLILIYLRFAQFSFPQTSQIKLIQSSSKLWFYYNFLAFNSFFFCLNLLEKIHCYPRSIFGLDNHIIILLCTYGTWWKIENGW
jgi:hypothetical protein